MDKLSKIMLAKAQQMQSYLQKLLDNDGLKPLQNKSEIPAGPFEAKTDLTQLDDVGMGLPNKLHERTQALFSRLSPYFESGMLFHINSKKNWKPQAAFQDGDFYPLVSDDLQTDFSFPEMTLVEILRLKESPTQKTLIKIGLISDPQMQVLAFKPHPEYVFLVCSQLPDVWLKKHSEKIQAKVLMLLGDY